MAYTNHRTPLTGAVLTIAVLLGTGCGQTTPQIALPARNSTTFEAPAPAPVQAAPEAAPEAPTAEAPAPAVVEDTQNGRVAIRVKGFGGYTLQATTDQIVRLRITLSGGPLSVPVVQEVTRTQLAEGKGQVVFQGIPGGTVNVKIEALDADGASLGSKDTTAVVTAGETTVVAATLKLDPTHVISPDGNLNLDLTVENGDVVVDPINGPSAAPSSPVLSPAPGPLPTPGVALDGTPLRSWYGDGTMSVKGSVKNSLAVSKTVTLSVSFTKKTLLGRKTVETQTVSLGLLAAKASHTFEVKSTQVVANWLGDGDASVTISAR